MRPLLFVNWASVSRRFCALMWLLAFVLLVIILAHLIPGSPPTHAPPRLPLH
jgi:hypothetical protein